MRPVQLLLLLTLASNGCALPPAARAPIPPLVVFTSGVDDSFRPVDRVERTSFRAGHVILFVRWFDVGIGEVPYRCEIRDGSGELIAVQEMTGKPKQPTWQTRTHHRFKPLIEQPGRWVFRVFLHGKLAVEAPLEVAAE